MRTVRVNLKPNVVQAIGVLEQLARHLIRLAKALGRAKGAQADLQLRMRWVCKEAPGINVCHGAAQRVAREPHLYRARMHVLAKFLVDALSRGHEAVVGVDVGVRLRLDDMAV